MKRSIAAAIACSLWISGAASAATLTYELNRPLVPEKRLTTTSVEKSPPLAANIPGTATGFLESSVLQIPVVTIVGRAATSSPRPRVVEPGPRDIGTMNCGEPRELDIGSGSVQLCE
jgi:hypothetical protein